MAGDDFSLTAGWGHFGQGEAVMPGHGRAVERPYTAEERARAWRDHLRHPPQRARLLAQRPVGGLELQAGRIPVLKNWLSYRERGVLSRALRPEEAQHFTDTARRIAGILGLVGAG